jgi:hypothetical protein
LIHPRLEELVYLTSWKIQEGDLWCMSNIWKRPIACPSMSGALDFGFGKGKKDNKIC